LILNLPKIFFGWWIVAASFLIALYTGGTIFYGFTAIFEPIAHDMGWSYTQLSFAASLRGLELGIFAPVMGVFVDRWGPRKLIFIGAIIITGGLILLSYAVSLAVFYGAYVIIAVGLCCCSFPVLVTAIAQWFRKNVGLATGIVSSGFGFGGLMIPVVVKLVEMYEWRVTMIIIAVGTLVTVLPLSLLMRHKPEQYGYLPDGGVEVTTEDLNSGQTVSQQTEIDFRPKQALKSNIFWRLALVFLGHMLVLHAVITHVMPYLTSVGVVRSLSSLVATVLVLMSILGRLIFGWLGDKFDRRIVIAVTFLMMGLGLLSSAYTSDTVTWLLVPFVILFGSGYGGNNALHPSVIRQYFGRNNFGTIFGLVAGIMMMGSIVGPPLAGWVFDTWGSYQDIWFIFTGLLIVAIIPVVTIPPVSQLSSGND